MSKRDDNWVVGTEASNGTFFMKHPRGEVTRDPAEAYGYHYKKDALEAARVEFKRPNAFVKRRKQCKSTTN